MKKGRYCEKPIIIQERIVYGYIKPHYTVEVKSVIVYGDNIISIFTGQLNYEGYFTIEANVFFATEPSIKTFNENGRVVYERDLEVDQYYSTALVHQSNYLTLKHYFVHQIFKEGYTYPKVEVSFFYLDGQTSTGRPPVTADSNGYFYAEVFGHQPAKKTNIVSVMHPETGEEILLAPYSWTREELDDAEW